METLSCYRVHAARFAALFSASSKQWRRQAFRTAAILLSILCCATSSASALTSNQANVLNQGIFYFDTELGCSIANGSTTLTGSTNDEQAFRYFLGKGLSATSAAAVVGNLMEESHLDPTIVQKPPGGDTQDPGWITAAQYPKTGWGIAQWTPGAKIIGIAKSLNITTPIYELATQLDIVWAEMTGTAPTGYQHVAAGLQQQSTLDSAVSFFQTNFESGTNYQQRLLDAQDAYSKYAKLAQTTGTGVSSTTSSGSGTCTNSTGGNGGNGSCVSTPGAGPFTDPGTSVTTTGLPYKVPITVQQMCQRAHALAEDNNPGHAAIFAQWCSRIADSASPTGCSSARCDYTASFIWGYGNSGFGYATANNDNAIGDGTYHWNTIIAKYPTHAHIAGKDADAMKPPVGALLFYNNSMYGIGGHIVVYLGNNWVVTSDMAPTADGTGKTSYGRVAIVHAKAIVNGPWQEGYLGWADPIIAGTAL